MKDVVRSAARTAERRVDLAPFLPGAGVDSQPVSARGYATVTLLGAVFGAAALRMHTAGDRVDALDEEGLQAAVEVVAAIAREVTALDAGSRDLGS
jgi:hypothetical protein